MNPFKFPSLMEEYDGKPRAGKNLFIYEKIDGGNVSIRRDGARVVPWSRGGPLGRADKYYFQMFRQFVFDLLNPEIYNLPENLILFGEFVHPGYGHILYNLQHQNKFFLLPIYNTDTKNFLHPQETAYLLGELRLDHRIQTVPLVRHGSIDETIAHDLVQHSTLYPGPAEGLVIHEYEPQYRQGLQLTKYYHPQFREYDHTREGVERYLTLRRFIKAGQAALAEGKEVTTEVMIEYGVADVVRAAKGISRRQVEQAIRGKLSILEQQVLPLFSSRVKIPS